MTNIIDFVSYKTERENARIARSTVGKPKFGPLKKSRKKKKASSRKKSDSSQKSE